MESSAHLSAVEVTIREASDNDLRSAAAIAAAAFRHNYPGVLSSDQIEYMLEHRYSSTAFRRQRQMGHIFLIASTGREPTAFASFNASIEDSAEGQVQKLYIRPDIQGRGLGRILVGEIENRMLRLGRSVLTLTVNRQNIQAINFYFKLGFQIRSVVDTDIGGGFSMHDFVMEKRLDM